MTTAEIESLLERVRRATGPDDELDADIWLAVIRRASRKNLMAEWPDEVAIWEYHDPERNLIGRSLVPRLSASVDACLALIERVLPGCEYEITNLYKVAMVSLPLNMSMVMAPQTARREDCNIPLALLEALLLALLHQASDKGMIDAE